ncbi:putative homeodomain-interacting protein kinase 2-like [Scophthalmus maximus]|uniref:Putative homeodomain-interacting protein kinase 2-like n=1 Tax=Scophthalmus maximus TaxID=52904 RepID=A0A2U9C693_SCOMX|nr:putative homeodomain-interacting protein kinase 2-like [Scophthalmus maximus]
MKMEEMYGTLFQGSSWDSPADRSRHKLSYSDKRDQDNSPESAPPTEKTFTDDVTDAHLVPTVCEPCDHGPAASISSDHGPATSISSDHGPAASISSDHGPATSISSDHGPAASISSDQVISSDHRPAASISSDQVISSDHRPAASISSDHGPAASIRPVAADEVNTRGFRRKKPFKRIRKFLGRIKKQFISIFTCGRNKQAFPKREKVIHSDTTSYRIMDFIGEGVYGKVAQCVDLTTGEDVAIKIYKENDEEIIQSELATLEEVRALHHDRHNIVKFIESFHFGELPCLVFEMLDTSLCDMMEDRDHTRLGLNEIRPVTQQLLVALEALKNMGIIHMDLKPDNIMLVDHKDQPFKIRLIDFGLALRLSQVEVEEAIQNLAYAAPEVVLGLRLSEAVDMWAVGCVMAYMYFGMDLFPFDCPYDWMNTVVHLLGCPDKNQINAGKRSAMYFILDEKDEWRLKSPEEFEEETGDTPTVSMSFFHLVDNLENAVEIFPKRKSDLEHEDRTAFVDLLQCCLQLSAEQRISPSEALRHRFITMSHLVDETDTSSYADAALEFMEASSCGRPDKAHDSSH